MKSSKVSINTRSTPASLSFKGQATKHTTVKWSIPKRRGPVVPMSSSDTDCVASEDSAEEMVVIPKSPFQKWKKI